MGNLLRGGQINPLDPALTRTDGQPPPAGMVRKAVLPNAT